jgi:glycopeptide antibiotics resistance protein
LNSSGQRAFWFPWLLWWVIWTAIALPWSGIDAEPHWERVTWLPWQLLRTRDAVLNLLFFVPFGVLAKAQGWRGASTVALAASVALATETAQLFAPDRFPSALDIVMNVAGAFAGVAGVWLINRAKR